MKKNILKITSKAFLLSAMCVIISGCHKKDKDEKKTAKDKDAVALAQADAAEKEEKAPDAETEENKEEKKGEGEETKTETQAFIEDYKDMMAKKREKEDTAYGNRDTSDGNSVKPVNLDSMKRVSNLYRKQYRYPSNTNANDNMIDL